MPACIGSQHGPELPLVVPTQGKGRCGRTLPSVLFPTTSLLPCLTRREGCYCQGTGKARAILVMVWLCLAWSHLHAQVLAAAVRLAAASLPSSMLARMVASGPAYAAVVQCGLPPSAGPVFSVC